MSLETKKQLRYRDMEKEREQIGGFNNTLARDEAKIREDSELN